MPLTCPPALIQAHAKQPRYRLIDESIDKASRWAGLEAYVACLHHPKHGPQPVWSFSFYAPTYGIYANPYLITLHGFADGSVVNEGRTGPRGEPFLDALKVWMNHHPKASAETAADQMPVKLSRNPSSKYPHLTIEGQHLRAIWSTYKSLRPGDRMMNDGYWPIVFGDAPDGSFTIGPVQESKNDAIPHWCAVFVGIYPDPEPGASSAGR